MQESRTIIIETDRDSVCAGDDMSRHNKFLEFSENIRMEELINELTKAHELGSRCAIWAGSFDNYNCICDIDGNWLVDKNTTAKIFFKDVQLFVYFDRESFGVKCKKK